MKQRKHASEGLLLNIESLVLGVREFNGFAGKKSLGVLE
jgi:hypothetical protein